MNPRRVAVGAVTAVLALLALTALTAMHALPMAFAHSDAAASAEVASVPVETSAAMHGGHVDGMVMPGTSDADATGATDSTDGVPPHGHSLLHLCVAVFVVGLSVALAAGLRRRPWTSAGITRIVPMRRVLSRDTGPPTLAGLCLLRC